MDESKRFLFNHLIQSRRKEKVCEQDIDNPRGGGTQDVAVRPCYHDCDTTAARKSLRRKRHVLA